MVSPERARYRADLRDVHARLLTTDAAYLTHEYLAEEHHPAHVTTLLSEAGAAGLTYLGDARPQESALELLPDGVRARAAGLDVAHALALLDFAQDTAFRRLSSCGPTRRRHAASGPLKTSTLRGGRAPRDEPSGPNSRSRHERGRDVSRCGVNVQVSDVARRVLHALAEVAPRSLACEDLARRVGDPLATVPGRSTTFG